MSDDRLDEAIAAYTGRRPAPPDAAATRTRLLRSALAAHHARRRRVIAAVAIGMLCTNATTWAWSSGELGRVWTMWGRGDAVAAATGTSDAGTTNDAVATVTRDAQAPAAVQANPPAVTTATQATPTPPPTRPTTALGRGTTAPDTRSAAGLEGAGREGAGREGAGREAVGREAHLENVESAALEAVPVTPDPLDNADRVAFEAAHRAHFERGADAVALAGWDAYLAEFPTGRFVPEATFNRAICLVRLGDVDAARPVLEAIAAGAHGTAHVADARALLAKLP
ncbi:MAG: hypothetical protein V4850_31880 [Myxococcota bacterium]